MRALCGLILVALASCANDDPNRFDLVCSGETSRHNQEFGEITQSTEAWSEHFIIDIEAKRYCVADDDCHAVGTIQEVNPDAIVLSENDYDIPGGLGYSRNYSGFQRVDGSFIKVSVGNQEDGNKTWNHKTEGVCDRRPFSGGDKLENEF